MSSAQESLQMVAENVPVNEVLFGIALLALVTLVVMEKLQPFRRFNSTVVKKSFVTNTTAS
jgi:hypothetical protein